MMCFSMKAQVRAQRKFAQGSRPVSPCVTPRKPKSASTPKKQPLPNVMPKTEDFLTFLCLRGKHCVLIIQMWVSSGDVCRCGVVAGKR